MIEGDSLDAPKKVPLEIAYHRIVLDNRVRGHQILLEISSQQHHVLGELLLLLLVLLEDRVQVLLFRLLHELVLLLEQLVAYLLRVDRLGM